VGYFSLTSLGAFLVYYFLFAAWCAGGIALASGFVVPMITVGAVYGRIIGKVMLLFTPPSVYNTPGIYALLGSAAFFAGVSRLSVSLTIIMIELSGDVLLAFPLMVSIMVAKNLADLIVHPLYHEQLALKGVPYLDRPTHELASMRVSDVMTKTVVVLREVESIARIDHLLSKHDYSSFPIVGDDNSYKGMIHRRELKILLSRRDIFLRKPTDRPTKILTWYEYKMLSVDKAIVKTPGTVSLNTEDYQCFIDFGPYLNTGIYSVSMDFFLNDAYELFRTLALTHLMVVNKQHQLVGVITRKDLLGENLALKQERKERRLKKRFKNAVNRLHTKEDPDWNSRATSDRDSKDGRLSFT